MIQIVSRTEIFEEKLKRRKTIKELEYHAHGHCVHVGKISPGCRTCFTGEAEKIVPGIWCGGGIQLGNECMYKCPYCYYDPNRKDSNNFSIDVNQEIADTFFKVLHPDYKPLSIAYQSFGETLLYMNELEQVAYLLKRNAKQKNINTYFFLYTNGLLLNEDNYERLKDWGIHEFRVHISASNFDTKVLKNIENGVKHGFTMSIEEPAWPLNKEKLINLLPTLNNIGIKHLNIIEMQVTESNIQAIDFHYPNAKLYHDYFLHMYDEGMVYDIIEEKIKNNYNFSVLDCDSGVENCRNGRGCVTAFDLSTIENMCAAY